MKTNYVLVDFENVQPRNLGLLLGGAFVIKIFLGASQTRLIRDVVMAVQPFGADAEYIQITGNGSNALDFHIAYYIGELAAKHPDSAFHVISKDTGFDPLLKHLKARGIECKRSAAITDIPQVKALAPIAAPKTAPAAKAAPAKKSSPASKTALPTPKKVLSKPAAAKKLAAAASTPDSTLLARYEAVLKHLIKQHKARPRTVKTLGGTIQNLHKPPLPTPQLQAIIDLLVERGKLRIDGTKVSYSLG